jgi:hypothetical protein
MGDKTSKTSGEPTSQLYPLSRVFFIFPRVQVRFVDEASRIAECRHDLLCLSTLTDWISARPCSCSPRCRFLSGFFEANCGKATKTNVTALTFGLVPRTKHPATITRFINNKVKAISVCVLTGF